MYNKTHTHRNPGMFLWSVSFLINQILEMTPMTPVVKDFLDSIDWSILQALWRKQTKVAEKL